MLQLILGRAGSGKTTELYRRIGQVAEAGGQAILLVPEQFSFENERELYLRLGPELSSRVEVLGFGRLCDNVFRYYGGLAGRALDDTARRILMGVTSRGGQRSGGLCGPGGQARLIEDMIGEIGELKAAGVTPDRLFGLALPGNPSLTREDGDHCFDLCRLSGAHRPQLSGRRGRPDPGGADAQSPGILRRGERIHRLLYRLYGGGISDARAPCWRGHRM